MHCAFCGAEGRAHDRVDGLDVCATCVDGDPSGGLLARGIHVDWSTSMGEFRASASIASAPSGLKLRCRPEGLFQKAMKLFTTEVQVGDPTFDAQVWVRTDDPALAGRLLGRDGVQSAVLGLLSGTRNDRIGSSHVTLERGVLSARSIPMGHLDDSAVRGLKLDFAALAVHLQGFSQD